MDRGNLGIELKFLDGHEQEIFRRSEIGCGEHIGQQKLLTLGHRQ